MNRNRQLQSFPTSQFIVTGVVVTGVVAIPVMLQLRHEGSSMRGALLGAGQMVMMIALPTMGLLAFFQLRARPPAQAPEEGDARSDTPIRDEKS